MTFGGDRGAGSVKRGVIRAAAGGAQWESASTKRYAMLVGNAGTGKTEIIKNYLNSLDKDADGMLSKNIVMSYYT